jgi:hypothetical protein
MKEYGGVNGMVTKAQSKITILIILSMQSKSKDSI